MSVHTLPDGRVICKWYEAGKIRKKYFGRGELAVKQAEAHDRTLKEDKKRSEADNLTIEEVCKRYVEGHQVRESTALNNYYKLTANLLPALGKIQAEQLKSDHLNKYIKTRIGEGVKLDTVKRDISVLKAALNWARRQVPPLILRNPIAEYKVEGKSEADVPSPPTEEEIRKLVECAEPHLARSICLQWYSGVRPGGEITRLRWSDVDLSRGKLRVVSARKGGPAIRYVDISTSLAELLAAWMEQDRKTLTEKESLSAIPVVHYYRQPVLSLKRSWAKAKERAGITRKLRLYDIRHAFATELLEQGASPGVVSHLMGHSREDTTQRIYLHVRPAHTKEVVNRMPGLGSLDIKAPKRLKKQDEKTVDVGS